MIINDEVENSYPLGDNNRPTNRLGCSRAFHYTKDNWKENNGYIAATHSLQRNHNDNNIQGTESSGQQSCKAKSSSTSLTAMIMANHKTNDGDNKTFNL